MANHPPNHPKIDRRGPTELIAEAEALTEAQTPWRRSPGDRLDALGALLRVFSRMAVHAVDALNRAPEQNFLSFLRMVGERPRPPLPARTPIAFRLAEGSSGATVPARTQVAAEDDDSVVFETTAPLYLSGIPLTAVFARDPAADRHADLALLLDPPPGAARPLLTGDVPLPHALQIGGGGRFAYPGLAQITARLDFTGLPSAAIAQLPLTWSAWDGAAWRRVSATPQAAAEGQAIRLKVDLRDLPPLPLAELAGVTDRWVRCDLRADALTAWWKAYIVQGQGNMIPAADILATLPALRRLALAVRAERTPAAPARAAFGAADLDLSKDTYPLGQSPTFADVLYLDPCDPTGLPKGTKISVEVVRSAAPPAAPTAGDGLVLVWEAYAGDAWREVGRSTGTQATSAQGAAFTDTTKALTNTGKVEFLLPAAPTPAPGEAAGAWLRARIAAGDYGLPARIDSSVKPPVLLASTLAPPVLSALRVGFVVEELDFPPSACLSVDDFVTRDRLPALAQGQAIPLFSRSAETSPALYLGFERSIGQAPMSLFFQTCPLGPAEAGRPGGDDPPRVQWEYRAPDGWRPVAVDDETDDLCARGVVRLSVPPDHSASADFGRELYWVRARHHRGRFRAPPAADRIAQDVVWARHAVTVTRDVLGSGAGVGAQSFAASRPPVLAGERLDVRERGGLSLAEARDYADPLGDAAQIVDDAPFGYSVWVRWRPVVDFRGSGPEDRHYTLDRNLGRVDFGDGVRGRPAPSGQNNIRMSYETGGGMVGNRSAGTISKLKSSLASISGAANIEPAIGGADAETDTEFATRSPTTLRHRGRAVAAADFEDLAFLASPEVARALAIAPRADPIAISVDLSDHGDPTGDALVKLQQVPQYTAEASQRAGRVRVIVVARGDQARPAPSAGLLDLLTRDLRARCAPGLSVEVSGPRWVEVRVTARLIAASQDAAPGLIEAARLALNTFLHPLTGGLDGRGWPFGRVPRKSDINRILTAVPGVDHVRGLVVACDPPPPDVDDSLSDDEVGDLASLMVFAGPHELSLAGVIGEPP